MIVLTSGLVIVGAGQVCVMMRQTGIIDGSLRVAQRSLVELREYVRLTAALAAAAEECSKAATKSNELVTRSFLLSHRPRLIVAGLYFHGGTGVFKEGSLMEGDLSVRNIGETKAKVVQICAFLSGKERLPMRPTEGAFVQSVAIDISPGECKPWSFSKVDGAITPGELARGSEVNHVYRVIGFVKYADEADPPNHRHTFFCRTLNRATFRFEALDGPEYECTD